jgi:hypothetical protein
MVYRDSVNSVTLKIALEINDFVRERTKGITDSNHRLTVASMALEAAAATFSLVEPEGENRRYIVGSFLKKKHTAS